MSYYDYKTDTCCREIFGWGMYPTTKEDEANEMRKLARLTDPLEDKIISELVYDVFCLLQSYDKYKSGDIGEDTYYNHTAEFKRKWLKPTRGKRAKEIVDDEINALQAKLYRAFSVEEESQ